jgi:hypothetical protein
MNDALALHVQHDDKHCVYLGSLRVVVVQDGPFWVAQGIEIDYCAQGDTEESVRDNFLSGLAATIKRHLERFGEIERLLKVAPKEFWEYAKQNQSQQLSLLTVIEVPEVSENTPYSRVAFLKAA